ncbi:MAG: MobF family relaxase [Nodosilinea sp.]
MITIRIVRFGRESYYLKAEAEDMGLGEYAGSGAARLGLTGEPREEDLRLLLLGYDPIRRTNLRLREPYERRCIDPETGREKVYRPVLAYDLVANAPKDVSILMALPETREIAIKLHSQALKAIQKPLESYCLISNRKQKQHIKAQPIIVIQTHTVNRDLEPHLHSHCLVLATGVLSNNRGAALESRKLLKAALPLGQIYRDKLRFLIEKELNLETFRIRLRKGESFGIKGIPEELRAKFSSRSDEICEYVRQTEAKTGKAPSATAVRLRVLQTRQPKCEAVDRDALVLSWQNVALAHELTRENLEIERKAYER